MTKYSLSEFGSSKISKSVSTFGWSYIDITTCEYAYQFLEDCHLTFDEVVSLLSWQINLLVNILRLTLRVKCIYILLCGHWFNNGIQFLLINDFHCIYLAIFFICTTVDLWKLSTINKWVYDRLTFQSDGLLGTSWSSSFHFSYLILHCSLLCF